MLAALAALAVGAARLPAQAPADAATGSLEVGVSHQWLPRPYGDWDGAFARLTRSTARDAWYVDGVAQRAFGDRGAFGAATYRRELTGRLFSLVGAGAGSGRFFFPRLRTDASLGVRWGARRSLVSTVGATYLRYPGGYEDVAATVATASYLGPATAELGVRVNRSLPGDVTSKRTFLALTLRTGRTQTIVARGDVGDEGYQRLSPDRTVVAFASRSAQLSWRARTSAHWGVTLTGEVYDNAFYSRTGLAASVTRFW